jgi:hypothetical protein
MNSKRITIKIIAPDTHQLLRSLRAIESLNPTYIEGQIMRTDDNGVFCFLTEPLNWFVEYEKQLTEKDTAHYTEQSSHEQPCITSETPINCLKEVT